MKQPHGGRRPGAGRKPLGAQKLLRINVMLGEKHIMEAKRLGGENVSKGIRIAIDKARRD